MIKTMNPQIYQEKKMYNYVLNKMMKIVLKMFVENIYHVFSQIYGLIAIAVMEMKKAVQKIYVIKQMTAWKEFAYLINTIQSTKQISNMRITLLFKI